MTISLSSNLKPYYSQQPAWSISRNSFFFHFIRFFSSKRTCLCCAKKKGNKQTALVTHVYVCVCARVIDKSDNREANHGFILKASISTHAQIIIIEASNRLNILGCEATVARLEASRLRHKGETTAAAQTWRQSSGPCASFLSSLLSRTNKMID